MRNKRLDLILDYKDRYVSWAWDDTPVPSTDDLVDKLEELDKEYAAAQKAKSPFYQLLTALDNDYALLKSAQGNPARLRAAMDAIRGDLQAYEESEGL